MKIPCYFCLNQGERCENCRTSDRVKKPNLCWGAPRRLRCKAEDIANRAKRHLEVTSAPKPVSPQQTTCQTPQKEALKPISDFIITPMDRSTNRSLDLAHQEQGWRVYVKDTQRIFLLTAGTEIEVREIMNKILRSLL